MRDSEVVCEFFVSILAMHPPRGKTWSATKGLVRTLADNTHFACLYAVVFALFRCVGSIFLESLSEGW
jgi:hypothetical protein